LKSAQPLGDVATSPDALGKKAEPKKEEAPQSKAPPKGGGMAFDDSISSILRSIPLEEEEKEVSPAPEEIVEEAPAKSQDAEAVQEVEDLLGFTEEEEEQPSITHTEGKQPKAKLICIEGELNPSEIELTENISIGRSPSNDIVLKEAKVSRQHAAINLIKGKYILVDLKSSNGVFVNGQKIEEHVLQDEDEINIGSYRLVYRGLKY
jgi:predicted component of type VI protein secretion system